MQLNQDRRRFLQTSAVAGAAVTLASVNPLQGDSPATPATTNQTNPQVRPGRVTWHRDFAAAKTASSRSGKPVFLFHMLGRMDQQFC